MPKQTDRPNVVLITMDSLRPDNLPNGLIESMACGTPCVSFAVGGVLEIVRHGETGLLARPADAEDLACCLHALLTDGALRSRMGREARRVAEVEYDVRLMADRYVRLYEELVEERARAGRAPKACQRA